MHYNTGQDFVRETKCIPHCPVLLCKTGWQHCSVTGKTPLDILQTHRCAVCHHQCTTTLVRTLSEKQNAFLTAFCFSAKQADSIVVSLQRHLWIFANTQVYSVPSPMQYNTGQDFVRETKCIPHCLLFLCKTGWQHCSVTAKTPLDILQTHRCTVSHHQCTTTLVRTLSEKQNAYLTAFCFSAKQADSIVLSLQRHLWIFLKHTGVQCPITNALQHWSRQNAFWLSCVALQTKLTAL